MGAGGGGGGCARGVWVEGTCGAASGRAKEDDDKCIHIKRFKHGFVHNDLDRFRMGQVHHHCNPTPPPHPRHAGADAKT